jgi:hypothetical protein
VRMARLFVVCVLHFVRLLLTIFVSIAVKEDALFILAM